MKKKIRLLIASLLTIILLYYFLRQINYSDIVQLFNSVSVVAVGVAFFFYSLAYVLRAMRFHLLLRKKVPFLYVFYTVVIHNFFINLLPLRTGEISYIYLLRKKKVDIAEGLGTLIIARSFDLLLVLLFFLTAAFLVDIRNQFMTLFILAAAIASVFVIIFLLFISFSGSTVVSLANSMFRFLGLQRKNLTMYLLGKLAATVKSFRILRSRHMSGRIFVLSLLLWTSLFLMHFAIFQSMGIQLSYLEAIVAAALIILLTSLPIQGLAGFGTFEAIWFFSLFSLGVDKELAITTSFGYHAIILFFVLVWSIYGLSTWLRLSRRKPISHE